MTQILSDLVINRLRVETFLDPSSVYGTLTSKVDAGGPGVVIPHWGMQRVMHMNCGGLATKVYRVLQYNAQHRLSRL